MSLEFWKLFLFTSDRAEAHAKLTTPVPRDPTSNGGNKTGPCGPVAKAATVSATYNAGENVTIKWTETINHPGRFFFAISSDSDVSFKNFATYVDDQNTSGMHTYSATFKLPDVGCENCTLQMIQSMEENPSAPSYYYSCADVKIVKAQTTSSPSPTPTPSPTSSPSSSVHTQSTDMSSSSSSHVAEGTKFGGGCGMIQKINRSSLNFKAKSSDGVTVSSILLLIPFLMWIILRNEKITSVMVKVRR